MAGPQDPTPLVGRDGELSIVRDALTAAAGGAPSAVVLSGPFGIGKTRLARRALSMAQDAGFTVLSGRSTGTGSTRGALTAALGAWLRRQAPDDLAVAVRDLPQLALLFSDLPVTPPPPLADPALERDRLEDGQVRLLERIVRDRPVALLLDDLYLADPGTWSMLDQVVTRLSDSPILMLVTIASDVEASAVHEMAHLRGALRTEAWQVRDLAVEPLGDDESAVLLSALISSGPDARACDDAGVERPALAEAVQACGGRPLFLESVAAALSEGLGPTLTGDVRSQILSRVRGLNTTARTVLGLLAVVEVELPVEVLVDAAAADATAREEVLRALDMLVRRRMAVEGENGYDLAHSFLRWTVRDALVPATRRRLFVALADAVEQHRLVDPILVVALGDAITLLPPSRALRLLRGAAGRARELGAVAPAIGLLRTAADVAAGAGLAREQADVDGDLGDLLAWDGAPSQAWARWTKALTGYTALADPAAISRAHRRLAELAWEEGEAAAATSHLDAAEESLAPTTAAPERMALAFARMVVASRTGDDRTLTRATDELDRLAVAVDAPAYRARAHLARGAAALVATDLVGAAEWTHRGLAAAESASAVTLMIRAHDQLAVVGGSQGDVGGFRRHSAASLDLARRLGSRTGEGWPLLRLAVADLLAGDWDAALRGTADLVAGAEQLHAGRGLASVLAAHSWVLTHRGRLAEAERALTRAEGLLGAELSTDRHIAWTVGLAGTTWALAAGDPTRAMQATALIGRPVRGWLSLLALATYAEAAVATGAVDTAVELAAEAAGMRSSATVLPTSVSAWVCGLVARAHGDTRQAVGCFEQAAQGFAALALPYQRARCLLVGAEVASETHQAVALARTALATFDTLGAPIDAQRARTVLRGLGITPSRGRARAEAVAGLSRRELEVARAVAGGLHNSEIATRLFISPRTVSTHLEHVYRRLGLSSRAALTRYLADSGMLDPSADSPDTA